MMKEKTSACVLDRFLGPRLIMKVLSMRETLQAYGSCHEEGHAMYQVTGGDVLGFPNLKVGKSHFHGRNLERKKGRIGGTRLNFCKVTPLSSLLRRHELCILHLPGPWAAFKYTDDRLFTGANSAGAYVTAKDTMDWVDIVYGGTLKRNRIENRSRRQHSGIDAAAKYFSVTVSATSPVPTSCLSYLDSIY